MINLPDFIMYYILYILLFIINEDKNHFMNFNIA